MHNPNLVVITGGPGSGKTTLLQELSRRGFSTSDEVARDIIQHQVSIGGDALPWANRMAYAQHMLQRSIQSFVQHHTVAELTFFDRGIPDTLCYLRLIEEDEAQAHAASQEYRYSPVVFLAPAWQQIYIQDSERKQDFQEAQRTAALMYSIYTECGYSVLELPLAPVAHRASFILQSLANITSQESSAT